MINSITPIVPSVIIDVRPPKATVGARQAKYRKRTAAMDFFCNPSVQSDR
jgi:hypothetical protein